MGKATLIARLAARDLRRRPTEVALLLVAIVAAMTTLTLGLMMREMVANPYQSTRDATSGPDVVAAVSPLVDDATVRRSDQPTDVAALEEVVVAAGVVAHSGPFPVANVEMEANGQTMDVQALGRDTTPAVVDQPEVTQGGWVEEGGVVVEAALAAASELSVGDEVTLNGRPFEVVGTAVTAAAAPYPKATCYSACIRGAPPEELADVPTWVLRDPGLVWVTSSVARGLSSAPASMTHVVNVQLEDPDRATEFADALADDGLRVQLVTWRNILEDTSPLVRDAQRVFLLGSGLLILLAMATVAVLVVGRMADQSRRVGLLKAVGGTPSLVAAVLLAEYVAVALLAALVGLTLGQLVAPLFIEPSVGLLGAVAPSLSLSTMAIVIGMAFVVAVIATFVPAVRAARSSTVVALADTAHAPRRSRWLIAFSSRLPTPLLLAMRTLGRRPRRVVFSILGIAVTVSGVVFAVAGSAQLNEQLAAGGTAAESIERLWPVLVVILATLVVLAAVNAVVITWTTALDARHASAVARALGATPQQVSAGLAVAQVLPAAVGAILGVPGGLALLYATDDVVRVLPPAWQFAAVVLLAVVVISLLTVIPARVGGRRSVVEILQSERG